MTRTKILPFSQYRRVPTQIVWPSECLNLVETYGNVDFHILVNECDESPLYIRSVNIFLPEMLSIVILAAETANNDSEGKRQMLMS